jgi:hypothetical protein
MKWLAKVFFEAVFLIGLHSNNNVSALVVYYKMKIYAFTQWPKYGR